MENGEKIDLETYRLTEVFWIRDETPVWMILHGFDDWEGVNMAITLKSLNDQPDQYVVDIQDKRFKIDNLSIDYYQMFMEGAVLKIKMNTRYDGTGTITVESRKMNRIYTYTEVPKSNLTRCWNVEAVEIMSILQSRSLNELSVAVGKFSDSIWQYNQVWCDQDVQLFHTFNKIRAG